MQDLVGHATAYQSGRLSHVGFYSFVESLCRKSDVLLRRYPVMARYIQYVLMADRINTKKLFEEMTEVEERIYAELAKTEKKRKLLGRLVGFI